MKIGGRPEGTFGLCAAPYQRLDECSPCMMAEMNFQTHSGMEAVMYDRMLNKQEMPTKEEMAVYCGDTAEFFVSLNQWLSETYGTEQKAVYPYGNHYGWGIAHRKKTKLMCNIFAEDNAFTVMMRLSDKQFESVYGEVQKYTQECIDRKYPCGDGGWIHYRITCKENYDDVLRLLAVKFQ